MPLSTQNKLIVQQSGEIKAIANVLGGTIKLLTERDPNFARQLTVILNRLDATLANLSSQASDSDVAQPFHEGYSKQLSILKNYVQNSQPPSLGEITEPEAPPV